MLSKYVVFAPYGVDKHIIFNVLSQGIALIDADLYHRLNASFSQELNLDREEIDNLRNFGVWVKSDAEDEARARYFFHKTRYSSRTAYITLVTTYACNLACGYCMQRYSSHSPNGTGLSREDKSAVFSWIRSYIRENRISDVSLGIIGGEPLLSFGVAEDIIGVLFDSGAALSTQVVTNGTLVSEEVIHSFKENNIDIIQITLDGPKDVHDKVRVYDGMGTFDLLKSTVSRLTNNGLHVSIRINYPKGRIDHAVQCVNELSDLTNKNLVSIYCFEVFDPQEYSMCKPMLSHESIAMHKQLLYAIIDAGFQCPYPMEALLCKASFDHSYVITPENDLYKCYCHIGSEEHRVGYIDSNGINIDDHTPMEMTIAGECVGCKFFPVCNGNYGCPSSLLRDKTACMDAKSQCAFFTSYELAITELLPIFIASQNQSG